MDEIKQTANKTDGFAFDKIINLVSEIVVIKARLQQLMENLVQESRDSKNVYSALQSVSGLLETYQKDFSDFAKNHESNKEKVLEKNIFSIKSNFDECLLKMTNSLQQAVVIDLDEVTARFGKVLNELQNVLMKTRVGDSSISIIQVLLVKVGDGVFAFPIEAVLEIVKIKKDEIFSVDGNETIKLREHALGLITLEKTIGTVIKEDDTNQHKRVVVISNGQEQIGVVVDSLLGEEDIVAKKLPKHFEKVKGISGASILGDGCIALILEPGEIIFEAKLD